MDFTQIFTQTHHKALIFVGCSRSKNEHLLHSDYETTTFCSNVLRVARSIKDAGLVGCVWIRPRSFKMKRRLFLIDCWWREYPSMLHLFCLSVRNCNVLLWTDCRKEEICYSQSCRFHSKFGNTSMNNLFWLYTTLFYEWDEICWCFSKSSICQKGYNRSKRS